ncbi:MAG: YceD family protein [Deltaproteobacteria bacterium]
MKIDLKTLKRHPHESQAFHLEAAGRKDLLQDLGAAFLEPIKVDLVVRNTGNLFVAHGELHTCISLLCSRCLEQLVHPIDGVLDFSIMEADQAGEEDSAEDVLILDQDEVDLQPLVEELMIMEIPLIPLCEADCSGLCPVCGINRNTGSCDCARDNIDPRWEKLKNLT